MPQHHAEPGVVVDLHAFGLGKSMAVVKQHEFEVIRLVVRPGKPIPEHQVSGPITVQCLQGTCTFSTDSATQLLAPGAWLYLDGGTLHSVEANEEAVLLVTILFPQ